MWESETTELIALWLLDDGANWLRCDFALAFSELWLLLLLTLDIKVLMVIKKSLSASFHSQWFAAPVLHDLEYLPITLHDFCFQMPALFRITLVTVIWRVQKKRMLNLFSVSHIFSATTVVHGFYLKPCLFLWSQLDNIHFTPNI